MFDHHFCNSVKMIDFLFDQSEIISLHFCIVILMRYSIVSDIILIFQMNSITFEDHRKMYESVPLSERPQFLEKMMTTPQLSSEMPEYHRLEYPGEGFFSYDSFLLHYHCCETTQAPKAIVVFLHGLYSYGGNSGYLGVNITKSISDVNFYSLDFINFGKSQGDCRGYIRSFDYLVSQGEAFVEFLLSKFQHPPKIFLVGQSLGGAIVFKMTLNQVHNYSGVIFLNPALRQIKQSQPIMKKVGKLIGYFLPKIKLTYQSFTSSTKYNTEKVVKENPYLYNDRHIPGSIRVALNAMQEIEKSYKEFKTSYILFQGGVDKSVDLFAPLDLEKQCQSKDKTTVYFKDMWHSVFYEEEIKDIADLTINWLSKRL